jgi:hypothetical protein
MQAASEKLADNTVKGAAATPGAHPIATVLAQRADGGAVRRHGKSGPVGWLAMGAVMGCAMLGVIVAVVLAAKHGLASIGESTSLKTAEEASSLDAAVMAAGAGLAPTYGTFAERARGSVELDTKGGCASAEATPPQASAIAPAAFGSPVALSPQTAADALVLRFESPRVPPSELADQQHARQVNGEPLL